jgi:hypothetical protein
MQKARFGSSLCKTCSSMGINIFATYAYEESEGIRNAIQQKLPLDLNSLLSTTGSVPRNSAEGIKIIPSCCSADP